MVLGEKHDTERIVATNIPTIAIFGLGFVGLPLALSFSLRGCRVLGIDVLPELVADLEAGITHHRETYEGVPIQDILRTQLDAGRFVPTVSASRALAEADAIIVTVGIPVSQGIADRSSLRSVCETIAKGLRPGQVIIMRTTMIPGTTEEFVRPILEATGMKAGTDFYLAYASERIAEGRAFYEFENVPCLVAGTDPESTLRAKRILGIVTHAPLVEASSIKTVEFTKVAENVQRDVNIAMVQEFARLCEELQVDIFEVVRLANTHPRVHLLEPGPGVGGYCIPNALHYMSPKAQELGVQLRLAPIARRINEEVPEFVASLVGSAVSAIEQRVPRVGVVGLAMKDFSNDDRLSPALSVVEHIQRRGYQVQAYDPAVPTPYAFKVSSLEECISGIDCLVILVKQAGVTEEALIRAAEQMPAGSTVIDTRNVVQHLSAWPTAVRIVKI